MKKMFFLWCMGVWFSATTASAAYLVGTGEYDITGPVAELVTMGYAAPAPKAAGLHQRLYARAFVVEDEGKSIAFVVTDLCFVSAAVKDAVVTRLQDRLGDRFNHHNIMITATHTHSALSGYSHNRFHNEPSGGISVKNMEAITDGIVRAIISANASRVPGTVTFAKGELTNATVNRSLLAYEENPMAERQRYAAATDPAFSQIELRDTASRLLGVFNWFAIHGTSMEKTNRLVSGDNKGYAAMQMQRTLQTEHPDVVVGFANANGGDASPNVDRDVDGDGDWECASNDNFKCAEESGEKQRLKAMELLGQGNQLLGEVDFRHRYVNFDGLEVSAAYTDAGVQATCAAAIGISMLAGSEEDGPGVGYEGNSCLDPGSAAAVLCDDSSCQGVKPVVLAPGREDPPGLPNIIPLQILRIGKVVWAGVPAEFTTMSGRRLRESLLATLAPAGIEEVVIAGYANAFSQYVATREEYQLQHYEGASTLYNEWTLAAYQQEFDRLGSALVSGATVDPGRAPPDTSAGHGIAAEARGPDAPPRQGLFGDLRWSPRASYQTGDTVMAEFWGANPNHDLRLGGTFYEIQQRTADGWQVHATDREWNTRMTWRRTLFRRSILRIEWDVPADVTGEFRIVYRGLAEEEEALIRFAGQTEPFWVRR